MMQFPRRKGGVSPNENATFPGGSTRSRMEAIACYSSQNRANYPRNLAESTTICNFAVENRETRRRLSRSTSGRLLPKGRKNLSELDCIRLARALQSKT